MWKRMGKICRREYKTIPFVGGDKIKDFPTVVSDISTPWRKIPRKFSRNEGNLNYSCINVLFTCCQALFLCKLANWEARKLIWNFSIVNTPRITRWSTFLAEILYISLYFFYWVSNNYLLLEYKEKCFLSNNFSKYFNIYAFFLIK